MNYKQIETKKILLFLIILFMFVPFVSAYKNIFIDINIQPQGVISTEYNTVGDIFNYNISLKNNSTELINQSFQIALTFPENQTLENTILWYNLTLEQGETKSIIPYINLSKNNDTYIWPFETEGNYKIEICSDSITRFLKNYNLDLNVHRKATSYYYYMKCFPHYFSAMPEWQYKLFQEESAAAKKVQEANQKLLNLNIELGGATQSMKTATWIMVGGAILTSIVAILTSIIAYRSYKNKR